MLRTVGTCLACVLCVSCADDSTAYDCFGSLLVEVPLASEAPKYVEVVWGSVSVVNECDGDQLHDVQYFAKDGNRVIIERGALGFYVPERLSIKIRDLGDCSGLPTTIYSVEDHVVTDEPSCREGSVTLGQM